VTWRPKYRMREERKVLKSWRCSRSVASLNRKLGLYRVRRAAFLSRHSYNSAKHFFIFIFIFFKKKDNDEPLGNSS